MMKSHNGVPQGSKTMNDVVNAAQYYGSDEFNAYNDESSQHKRNTSFNDAAIDDGDFNQVMPQNAYLDSSLSKDQLIEKLERSNEQFQQAMAVIESKIQIAQGKINTAVPFKAKSHRFELNPEDSDLATQMAQLKESQANITLMKAQIERLKKRIALLEKSRDLTSTENQVKAVELEIEQLNQKKRGLQSIFGNQNREYQLQHVDKLQYGKAEAIQEEIREVKTKYKSMTQKLRQDRPESLEQRKEILSHHYQLQQLKSQVIQIKITKNNNLNTSMPDSPSNGKNSSQQHVTLKNKHLDILTKKQEKGSQYYELQVEKYQKTYGGLATTIAEKEEKLAASKSECEQLLQELESLRSMVSQLPPQPKQQLEGRANTGSRKQLQQSPQRSRLNQIINQSGKNTIDTFFDTNIKLTNKQTYVRQSQGIMKPRKEDALLLKEKASSVNKSISVIREGQVNQKALTKDYSMSNNRANGKMFKTNDSHNEKHQELMLPPLNGGNVLDQHNDYQD